MNQYIRNNLVYKSLREIYRSIRFFLLNIGQDTEDVFTEIYNKNIWGKTSSGQKYFSGGGTNEFNIKKYKSVLLDFIKDNNIQSIFEIGCGDFSIMKPILHQTKVNYTGSDIVKGLIDHLSENYGGPNTQFIHLNAIKSENLVFADLCIIRQVLQHIK